MIAAPLALWFALAPASTSAPAPRGYQGPDAATPPASPPILLRTQVAAQASEAAQEPESEAQAAEPEGAAATRSPVTRYFQAPLTDAQWRQLEGREVLLIFGTSGRECVTLTRAEKTAVRYVHRKNGAQQAPLGTITSVHENSWECELDRDETPAEWARVGAAVGVSVAALGMVIGVLYDAGRAGKTDPGEYGLKHFMYAPIGVTTNLLGTPIVAIGGASTSRDLRVRGKPWARGLGYALYAGSVITTALWLVGQYAEKDPLAFVGITSLSGALGFAGASFMAVDALASRAELRALHRQDTGQTRLSRVRFGAGPFGQGFALSLGGRF